MIESAFNLAFNGIFGKKWHAFVSMLMITSNLNNTSDMPNEKRRCTHLMYILLHMSSFYLLHLKHSFCIKIPLLPQHTNSHCRGIWVCNNHTSQYDVVKHSPTQSPNTTPPEQPPLPPPASPLISHESSKILSQIDGPLNIHCLYLNIARRLRPIVDLCRIWLPCTIVLFRCCFCCYRL